MLGNVKVRTKLIAILAAPVLALLAVAGVGVADRAAVARETRAVGALAELATGSTAVVRELGRESVVSAAALADPAGASRTSLEAQRDRTDQAVDGLREARRTMDAGALPPELQRTVDDALDQLRLVESHRSSVDKQVTTYDASVRVFAQLADQLLSATSGTVSESGQASLAAQMTAYNAAVRAGDLAAQEEALVTAVGERRRLTADDAAAIRSLDERQQTQYAVFDTGATAEQRVALRNALAARPSRNVESFRADVLETPAEGVLDVDVAAWGNASTAKAELVRAVEEAVATRIVTTADGLHRDASRDQWAYVVLASGAALIALFLALLVARATVRPLRRLTEAAYAVSQRQLPRLIEGLRNPISDVPAPELTPIEVDSTDEVGQLAEAFNSIQTVAVDVAVEQAALLRKGIGDMFVNLARRNQSLLDRQITFLDELEANERDPDTLDHLFKLDHLATRMRRNAESLLVLAGVEPARRWGEALPLGDVVRAAVSEVEDYARVNVLALDESRVAGKSVVDVAHLLAELLDNATAYSPPDTSVDVVGRRTDRGYVLTVTDLGIGMTEVQLAGANRILAHPPVMGLALSRSLGLVVVARLVDRHGIGVRLSQTSLGGVTATVTLPVTVLAPATGDEAVPAARREPAADIRSEGPASRSEGRSGPGTTAASGGMPPVPASDVSLPVRVRRGPVDPRHPAAVGEQRRAVDATAALPTSLAEAVPEGLDFEAGLAALTFEGAGAGPPSASLPQPPPPVTAAGLPRRTPKRPTDNGDQQPVQQQEDEVPRSSRRSPEEIQSMLSRYRSGRQRGRDGSDEPREDEG